MNKKSDIERFHQGYLPGPSDECWLWTKALYKSGLQYGQFSYTKNGRHNGIHAHRWIFQYLLGRKLGRWEFVCHKCDVPHCVNPGHLYLGDAKTNAQDMAQRGRADSAKRKGQAHPMHKLCENDIEAIKNRYAAGETQLSIAKDYPVSDVTISRVVRSENWKHTDPLIIDHKQRSKRSGASNGARNGEKHPMARLNESDVIQIREQAALGIRQRIIAEQFNISNNQVNRIHRRLAWSHLT